MTDENEKKQLVISDAQGNGTLPFSIDLMGITARPTKKDKKWAHDFYETDKSTLFSLDKTDKLLRSIAEGHYWRVAFALYLDEKLEEDKKFITPDLGKAIFLKAIKEGHEKIVKCLLENDFFQSYAMDRDTHGKVMDKLSSKENKNILKIFIDGGHLNINALEQEILVKAAILENTNMCLFILELGSDYNHALKRIKKRDWGGEIFALNTAIEMFQEKAKSQSRPKAKPLEIENKNNWEPMDDDQIVKHETIPSTDIKLEKIFNFKARNVTTICRDDKTTSPTIHIQNFQDIEDDSALFEAWQKLKNADKTPPDFTGNDNYIVSKPTSDSKIKIEGR